MKQMKNLCCLACSLGAATTCAQGVADEGKRPNVLFLFSDQHNKTVMGYEGHSDVITPHLDKLAGESVVFDRAYCTVGVSAPSRTSLMSGLYPRTLGLMSNEGHTSVTDCDAVSLASVFKMNGYDTYSYGKRHTIGVVDEGWDEKRDHRNLPDEENYVKWIEKEGYLHEFALDWAAEFGKGPQGSREEDNRYSTGNLGTRLSALPEEYTMEAWTARNTIEMIRRRKPGDKPFFCWATFYRPHQPYNPQKRYMEMYDVSRWGEGRRNGGAIRKPASLYEPAEMLPPEFQAQRSGKNRVWNLNKAFENEQIWRDYIGGYYALVTEIDHWIGEILSALEEAGLEEETIVIYSADHGDFVGNHGMVEKCAVGHNVYEDILNVPLIFKYPGKTKAGVRNHELVSLVDIMPTLVDMLGLELPEKMKYELQGESLSDVMLKDRPVRRRYLVSESWSQAAVITPEYKLGIWKDPTAVHRRNDYRSFGDMFYVRGDDPLELNNRLSDPEYRKVISRLRKYYDDFVEKVPDSGLRERVRRAEEQQKKSK